MRTIEQLRRIPTRDPLNWLEEIQHKTSEQDSAVPRISVHTEGGGHLQGEFLSFQRSEGLALLTLHEEGLYAISLIACSRIVAITIHYDEGHLRRLLDGPSNSPSEELPTRLGLRRELDAWTRAIALRHRLNFRVEIDWDTLGANINEGEAVHFLAGALKVFKAELGELAGEVSGRDALNSISCLRFRGAPELTIEVHGDELQVGFPLQGKMAVAPEAEVLRRRLDNVL